jgi:regulator of RNase E activity RraA
MVGYARTVAIRSVIKSSLPAAEQAARRIAYYEYVGTGFGPRISVIQDIDGPDIGYGAFWGEVQSHVHKGLGCAGVITDGSVRDLEAMAPDFLVLAGSVMPSHAHVHLVDYGGTVSVAGMVVSPNDIIHADRHGAVVVPPEAVKEIPAAVALISRREKVIIEASKAPGFSIAHLRQALDEAEDIHYC